MAKFRYRMQNILDVKLKLESQAKIAYGQANKNYQDEQQKLQDIIIKKAYYDRNLKQMMEGPLNITELKHAREAANSMKTIMRRQLLEVHKAEMTLEAARKALEDIVKERKTQEILKEKAFEEFKKDLLKQESKEIDELVSYTFNPN